MCVPVNSRLALPVKFVWPIQFLRFPLPGTDSWNRMRYMILVMFCPECRAEYRPGFTRCSDCDVDLVHEIPEQDTRVRKRKRDSATMFPTFRNMYREGGRTVQWWTSYRHQTGACPWFSIVIHFMNWVVILIGGEDFSSGGPSNTICRVGNSLEFFCSCRFRTPFSRPGQRGK
jgi:hypothetical protein